jgi:BioD-like phosphotransacetylase family protein
VREELNARVLCGEQALDRVARHTLIAAMTPQHMLSYLHEGALVITPGDRVDNILVAISTHMTEKKGDPPNIAGIVLTCGFVPHPSIMPMLEHTGLPVLLCEEDTYSVSSSIFNQVFKIVSGDMSKVEAARRFVREYVDVDALVEEMKKG